MAEKKRQCGTCRFFVEKEHSGHGKCTHPKRAGTDADLLLLRPTELACRTKWGDSLWQDPEDESDPMKPQSPQQPTLPEPIAAQLQFDDEVTSVSIAGSKSSRSSYEDDVVDSGATATGMASWNDPVQDERLNLLRKSDHDALAGARKRHMERQARQRELIPFADDEEASEPKAESRQESTPKPDQEQPLEPTTERKSIFPPDDFVEDEFTAAREDDSFDDETVDEGVAPDRQRSPRMRNLLREQKNPKKSEAMRMNVPAEMQVTSNNPEQRVQWSSVPEVDPHFELPLKQPKQTPAPSNTRIAAHTAPSMTSSYQPRPISQARELVSEDRIRSERAQRTMVQPILDQEAEQQEAPQPQFTIDRPRLSEAPAPNTRQIDRLKDSPLRGYRRTAQETATPEIPRQQRVQQQPNQSPVQQPRRIRPQQQNLRETQRPTEPDYSENPARQQRQDSPRPTGQRERPMVEQTEQPEVRQRPQQMAPHREQQAQEIPADRRPHIALRDISEPFQHREIEISPEVPRCCGTCSSFQPGGVDGRGSCTNRFAGPVQRVVHEQDLACNHTYGSLWLPADEEVWLEELQTDYPPTPRVDAMLARRRRRENPVLPDLDELTS